MKNNVIFDMDGVIVDNMAFHVKAWSLFCERHNLNVSEQEIRAQFGKKNIEHFQIFFNMEISEAQSEILAMEKETIYREIFSKEIKPVKGLVNLLEELKKHNYKIAVATSAPVHNVDFVMDTLNLRHYFDTIVDETFVKYGKPNPQIFLKAAEFLGVAPETCLVFEDTYHGIDAALAAKMKVVGLLTTYPPEYLQRANLLIHDFDEVNLEIINKLIQNN